MTLTKVKKHNRQLGKKKIRVRKHNRRTKSKISKRKRKVFTGIAKQPFEVGGQMDFERGKLENAKMHFGDESELEFDWDPDYEVSYHTHPNVPSTSIMPSYEDMISMKEFNEKEQIIFYRNVALSIAETKKFEDVSNKKIKQVSDALQYDFGRGMSDKKIYKKYKPIFKRVLGLEMKWHPPRQDIELSTRSI